MGLLFLLKLNGKKNGINNIIINNDGDKYAKNKYNIVINIGFIKNKNKCFMIISYISIIIISIYIFLNNIVCNILYKNIRMGFNSIFVYYNEYLYYVGCFVYGSSINQSDSVDKITVKLHNSDNAIVQYIKNIFVEDLNIFLQIDMLYNDNVETNKIYFDYVDKDDSILLNLYNHYSIKEQYKINNLFDLNVLTSDKIEFMKSKEKINIPDKINMSLQKNCIKTKIDDKTIIYDVYDNLYTNNSDLVNTTICPCVIL